MHKLKTTHCGELHIKFLSRLNSPHPPHPIHPTHPLLVDGTLSIYIQPLSPGPSLEPNWLPTPPDTPFLLWLRAYAPTQAAINGSYWPSRLQEVGSYVSWIRAAEIRTGETGMGEESLLSVPQLCCEWPLLAQKLLAFCRLTRHFQLGDQERNEHLWAFI